MIPIIEVICIYIGNNWKQLKKEKTAKKLLVHTENTHSINPDLNDGWILLHFFDI